MSSEVQGVSFTQAAGECGVKLLGRFWAENAFLEIEENVALLSALPAL